MPAFALTPFAFAAGLLSILSPCVLPILPMALGGAVTSHRFGTVALAAGLAVSFTSIGLFVATLGFAVGLGSDVFQFVSAILLVLVGIVLVIPVLQERVAAIAAPLSDWVASKSGGYVGSGLLGQFGLGLLFGAIWAPCSGPTLGAAALMAASGHNLLQVGVTMLVFGVGAALPLVLLGTVSRATLLRLRGTLASSSAGGKMALGTILVVFGLAILSGFNQTIETYLVLQSPEWLSRITSLY